MNRIHFYGEKVLKRGIIISSIVAILCLSYSIYYGIAEKNNQSQVKNAAASVTKKLKQDDGVQDINLNLACKDPQFIPSDNNYIIFVEVEYESLRKRTEDEWVKYLVGEHKIQFTYIRDRFHNYHHFYYTQKLLVPNYENSDNPVVITVSDNAQSYFLKEASEYDVDNIDDLAIEKANAYERVNPAPSNVYKRSSEMLGILFVVITGLFVYFCFKKKSEIKEAATQLYEECKEKNITEKDADTLKDLVAYYAKNSGVTNFEEVVFDIYDLGKNEYERLEGQKSNKHNGRKVAILIGALAIVIIAGVIIYQEVIVPTKKYEDAVSLKNSGDMESAYDIFKELGNFKDSKTQCDEYDYSEAVAYYNAGQFAKSYMELAKIEDYEPATELSNSIKNDHPYVEILTANIGDTVLLGEYEQDKNGSNGKEPIEWIVLGYEGDKMLLISKYILDAQKYNTSNSLDCTLDDWVSDTFFLKAFSDTEIDENILCTMLFFDGDQELYFSGNDYYLTTPTEYAKSIRKYETLSGKCPYWLAGDVHGDYSGKANAPVGLKNEIGTRHVEVQEVCGVRPTLWICPGGEATFPAKGTYSGEVPVSRVSTHGGGSTGDKCPTCNGTGTIKYYYGSSALDAALSGHDDYEFGPCPTCHGSGKAK